jgi:hypothetical protein
MADTTLTQTISTDTVTPHALANMTSGEPRMCCGGPSPTDAGACCARDADVKAAGGAGCGRRGGGAGKEVWGVRGILRTTGSWAVSGSLNRCVFLPHAGSE